MTEASTFDEMMASVPHAGFDPRLSGAHGTVRFDVADAGSWRLQIDDGKFTLLDGAGDADLVVSCSADTLLRVIDGRQNLITACLQGRVRASGDLTLAVRFHGVLEARRSATAAAPTGASR